MDFACGMAACYIEEADDHGFGRCGFCPMLEMKIGLSFPILALTLSLSLRQQHQNVYRKTKFAIFLVVLYIYIYTDDNKNNNNNYIL